MDETNVGYETIEAALDAAIRARESWGGCDLGYDGCFLFLVSPPEMMGGECHLITLTGEDLDQVAAMGTVEREAWLDRVMGETLARIGGG